MVFSSSTVSFAAEEISGGEAVYEEAVEAASGTEVAEDGGEAVLAGEETAGEEIAGAEEAVGEEELAGDEVAGDEAVGAEGTASIQTTGSTEKKMNGSKTAVPMDDMEGYPDLPIYSVSSEPTTWSTDKRYVRNTFLRLMPELADPDLTVNDLISGNAIMNGKVIEKYPAMTLKELEKIFKSSAYYDYVSFNAIKLTDELYSDLYLIQAYGIMNDFDGENYEIKTEDNFNEWDNEYASILLDSNGKQVTKNDKILYKVASPSYNSYYGWDQNYTTPAGVYDGLPFTWYAKSGGSDGNGRIIYRGALVHWSQGKDAERDRFLEVENLVVNGKTTSDKKLFHATVSFDYINGQGGWIGVENKKRNKGNKDIRDNPRFYPKFKLAKTMNDKTKMKEGYRDKDGTLYLLDKTSKKQYEKFKKRINKLIKNSYPIAFEIRRRPLVSTVSTNYTDNRDGGYIVDAATDSKFMSVNGSLIEHNSAGTKLKFKDLVLQFKTKTYKYEKDVDVSDSSESKSSDNSEATGQARVNEWTMVLKKKSLKDIDTTKGYKNVDVLVQDKTSTIQNAGGYPVLLVKGINDLEGTAAIRERPDRTVGIGYWNSDTDNFITSLTE